MSPRRAISLIIIAAMIAISTFGWIAIPEDTMIARHWNLAGEPDGFSPRNHILFGMPLVAVGLTLLFMLIPKIEPRKAHTGYNAALLTVSWLGSLGMLLVVHASIVFTAIEGNAAPPLPQATLFASCALIMLVGNFTAKSRSNFFLGVRTPWTLSSEHAWSVANRAAGWMFVLSAVGAMATGISLDTLTGFKVLIASVLAAALMSVAISYFAWRSDPARQDI